MPQRLADAAHIVPYLTHHGQQTLIPPENAGRARQAKSKKSRTFKQEKSSGRAQNENPSTAVSAMMPASAVSYSREAERGQSSRYMGQRHPQEHRYSEIPDYPPPTFQEAMSSPPLSVCPSTATLGFYNSPERTVPLPPSRPATSDIHSDSDSDESDIEIIDAQRNSTQIQDELGHDVQNRGRVSLDAATPAPAPSIAPKRRHMSLSPLRTLFPHKPIPLQDRALSAQSASPYSHPRNASIFRSTTSLKTISTGSFFRLPLSAPSCTSLVKSERKGSSKGKDRVVETLDSWEVLNSEPLPSLMSAVESLTNPPSPESGTPSPTQIRFSGNDCVSPFSTNPNPQSLPSCPVSPLPTTLNLGPHHVCGSSISTDGEESQFQSYSKTPSLPGVARPTARTHYLHDPTSSSSILSLLPNPGTSPPSPTSRKSPLSKQPWGTEISNTENSDTFNLLQLAVETPLPTTPVDTEGTVATGLQPSHSSTMTGEGVEAPPSISFVNNVTTMNLQRSRSHAMPDCILPGNPNLHREIPHAIKYAVNDAPVHQRKPIPSPLQFPSLSVTTSVPSHEYSSSDPFPTQTPSRHHYPGRPLPKTPQPETARNMIDSLYAPHPDSLLNSNSSLGSVGPDDLLIDFNESTRVHSALSSEANSPASTVRPSSYSRAQSINNEEDFAGGLSVSRRTDENEELFGSARETDSLADTAASSVEELSVNSVARNAPVRYSNLTDLDLLVSQLDENDRPNGSDYDTLHLLSEIIGPAQNTEHSPEQNEPASPPLLAHVSLDRRRVTRAGKVRIKLSLLDIPVDKCGVCLTQFKENDLGAMSAKCRHAFHERCLRPWLARSRSCPLCRVSVGRFPEWD